MKIIKKLCFAALLLGNSLTHAYSAKEYDDILHAFKHFLPAVENTHLEQLYGGFSSAVLYKCSVDKKIYVVRILAGNFNERKNEICAQIKIAQIGMAPKVYYYDPDYSLIIMDFLSGNSLNLQEARRQPILKQVAQLVAALNMMPTADFAQRDMFVQIHRYFTELTQEKNELTPLINRVMEKVQLLEQKITDAQLPYLFSHGDLNPRNIFWTDETLMCIDWEGAGAVLQFFDLAYFSVQSCLRPDDDIYLLSQYLHKDPSPNEMDIFKSMKLVVRVADAFGLLTILLDEEFDLSSSIDDVKDFTYYQNIFASDVTEDSHEFCFSMAISQLREFFKEMGDIA